jgi:hypothetical protein
MKFLFGSENIAMRQTTSGAVMKYLLSILFIFSSLSIGYADELQANLEQKYSVRKFDTQVIFTSKDDNPDRHAFLHSTEYPDFIFFEGAIIGPLLENFIAITSKHPEAKYLLLDSGGGSVTLGIQLGELLPKFGFSTVTLSNSVCASACSLVFVGGQRRYVFGNLKLHQTRYFINGEDPCSDENSGSTMVTAQSVDINKQIFYFTGDLQQLISSKMKYLKGVPQGIPDWFITETLDRDACLPLYKVPSDRMLELSNRIESAGVYDQIKSLQQEEGSLLALEKFHSSNSVLQASISPEPEDNSVKDDAELNDETMFVRGSLTLSCAAQSSEYDLNFSSFSFDTAGEFNFEMLLRDASDNACNVPKKGLDGKILVTTSDGLARIEIPLTDKSGNSFFWHEVFGVDYEVDIKFDFSRNIGVGENVELKLYQ